MSNVCPKKISSKIILQNIYSKLKVKTILMVLFYFTKIDNLLFNRQKRYFYLKPEIPPAVQITAYALILASKITSLSKESQKHFGLMRCLFYFKHNHDISNFFFYWYCSSLHGFKTSSWLLIFQIPCNCIKNTLSLGIVFISNWCYHF